MSTQQAPKQTDRPWGRLPGGAWRLPYRPAGENAVFQAHRDPPGKKRGRREEIRLRGVTAPLPLSAFEQGENSQHFLFCRGPLSPARERKADGESSTWAFLLSGPSLKIA